MFKPRIYTVTDIETTFKRRMAFDIAWKHIDKHGNVYGKGSYIVKEAFAVDVPYFKEKMGHYFSDTYAHLIEPLMMGEIKEIFNGQITDLHKQGYGDIVFAAYNAAFDTKYLGETCETITGGKFLAEDHGMKFLDIWDGWGNSCPMSYAKRAARTDKGNIKTSAEEVYRVEFKQPDFNEAHIAYDDVNIEGEILQKVISRKQTLPIVDHPSQFAGNVWRKINVRLEPERFAKKDKQPAMAA